MQADRKEISHPYVSNIQRFSLDDGPGIRTTVFFKGCNLHCAWCHNPECIVKNPTLQYWEDNCVNCGRCVAACPEGAHILQDEKHVFLREKCNYCGKCADLCRKKALVWMGKYYEPEELLAVICRDRAYFSHSGGGVTFSGGEPMLYSDYLIRIARLCREEGLHVAVDTAGNVPEARFDEVMPVADLFLYDVKCFDEDLHRYWTGVSNKQILSNLQHLHAHGASVFVRVPVIREFNGNLAELEKVADFLAPLTNIQLVQLLPYHSYGLGKYKSLGTVNILHDHTPPSAEFMEEACAMFVHKGINARVS